MHLRDGGLLDVVDCRVLGGGYDNGIARSVLWIMDRWFCVAWCGWIEAFGSTFFLCVPWIIPLWVARGIIKGLVSRGRCIEISFEDLFQCFVIRDEVFRAVLAAGVACLCLVAHVVYAVCAVFAICTAFVARGMSDALVGLSTPVILAILTMFSRWIGEVTVVATIIVKVIPFGIVRS